MQASNNVLDKYTGCRGVIPICQQWKLAHNIWWTARCSRCKHEIVLEKDGRCFCCIFEKLARYPLKPMQVRDLALFYNLVKDRGITSICNTLEIIKESATTYEIMLQSKTYNWHKNLLKLQSFGMVQRKPTKHNNQQAIINTITQKGKQFLFFAIVYNSSLSNGNGNSSLSSMKVSRPKPQWPNKPHNPFSDKPIQDDSDD